MSKNLRCIFLAIFSLCLGVWSFSGCKKDEDKSEKGDDMVYDTKKDLPECNSDAEKRIAYITSLEKFYRCDGKEWLEANIEATAGNASVYDANDNRLGELFYNDYSRYGIRFSDEALGVFQAETGEFLHSVCVNGNCTGSVVELVGVGGVTHNYCYYKSADCSTACLIPDKPIKNSLYYGKAGWFKATGEETAETSTGISTAWRHDLGDCAITQTSNLGFTRAFPVTNSYSGFPDDLEYPFEGPLYLE